MKDIITHSKLKSGHYLTVTPDGRRDTHQIAIQFGSGTGHDYKEGDRAQVDIWISGKPVFTGTFEDLQNAIKPEPAAAKYKPGQPIQWSYGNKSEYFVIKAYNYQDNIYYLISDRTGQLQNHVPEREILPL